VGIPSRISGFLFGHGLEVTSNGAARTAEVPRPPDDWSRDEVEQVKELREAFKDSSGSADLGVDGSVTPVEYSVKAEDDRIKWVKEIVIGLHDQQMSTSAQELRRFGAAHAAPGLTNGVLLTVRQNGQDTELFAEIEAGTVGVKSIVQFYRWGEVISLEAAITSTIDVLIVKLTLLGEKGVGLYPGSKDRIFVTVQDDLSATDLFGVHALGTYELLE
jgi:hypothetical protein